MILHEIQIGDLGKIITGKTPPTSDSENYNGMIPFITPVDLNGRRNIFLTERYISDKGKDTVKNCLLPKDSVCVSCIGSDMGKAAVTTCPSVTNQQINSIIVNSQYNHLYVYYLMCTLEQTIKSLGKNGTAIPILNKSKFSSIKIRVPELSDQVRVANILSAYDDLIENNQKQIKLLEEAAQRLYKEWFIDLRFPGHESTPIHDDIPEGWERTTVEDLCSLRKKSLSPDMIMPGTPYIGLEHIPRKDFCLSTWGDASEITSNKYEFCKNDIIFGQIRPYFHKVGFAIVDGVSSTDSFVMTPQEQTWGLFLMTVSSEAFVNYAYQTCKEGAKMPRADWNQMKEYQILVANKDIQTGFEGFIKSITRRVSALAHQNKHLAEARDRLLPKLMSGEIEV